QVTEGNFVQSKAERTSSLAIIAAAVESGGICGSCPALWPGRGGGRCICRRERRIAGGARFTWGRAQPRRARTGAAVLGRYLEIIRSRGPVGVVVLARGKRCEDKGYAGRCVLGFVARGGGLGAVIPLPQGIAPPVTEVVLPRLTALLISLENKVILSGSPRRLRERRVRNQRDQRESGDKRFHDASP